MPGGHHEANFRRILHLTHNLCTVYTVQWLSGIPSTADPALTVSCIYAPMECLEGEHHDRGSARGVKVPRVFGFSRDF